MPSWPRATDKLRKLLGPVSRKEIASGVSVSAAAASGVGLKNETLYLTLLHMCEVISWDDSACSFSQPTCAQDYLRSVGHPP